MADSHQGQILFMTAVGALSRCLSFAVKYVNEEYTKEHIETDIEVVEVFARCAKDLSWVLSFSLVTFYWIELQNSTYAGSGQAATAIKKTLPWLYYGMGIYTFTYLLKFLFQYYELTYLRFLMMFFNWAYMLLLFVLAWYFGSEMLEMLEIYHASGLNPTQHRKMMNLGYFLRIELYCMLSFFVLYVCDFYVRHTHKGVSEIKLAQTYLAYPFLKIALRSVEFLMLGVLVTIGCEKEVKKQAGDSNGTNHISMEENDLIQE